MARIDIEDLEEDREIKKEEMKKAFGGFGFSSGTSVRGNGAFVPNNTRVPGDSWFPGSKW